MARVDYDAMASRYDAARSLELESLEPWRVAISPYLQTIDGPILDLGSGTGQFSGVLADWFDVDVVAVEPSDEMRTQAAGRSHPRVRCVAGCAEAIPLEPSSVGAAWLSTVIHHFDDLPRAAVELRRVLRPGARVLLRSSFPSRHEHIPLFRFFPEAGAVARTFPSAERVESVFEKQGFLREHLDYVFGVAAGSLEELRDRAVLRADTTLANLSDEAFAAGLARIDGAIAEGSAGPVSFAIDLLVLGRA